MLEGFVSNIFNSLGIEISESLLHALSFFIIGTVEILVLIFLIMTIVSFVESFIDKEKLRERIEKGKYGTPYIFATFLGIITPFCSCSSIPMFIGFLKSRIPLGVAISFLVTSPLVNEIVFVMLGSMFSWGIAFVYAILGITLGILVGIVIDKIGLEKHINLTFEDEHKKSCCSKSEPKIEEKTNCCSSKLKPKIETGCGCGDYLKFDDEKEEPKNNSFCNKSESLGCCSSKVEVKEEKISNKITLSKRFSNSLKEARKTLKDMYKIVLFGIAIGSLIHGYVPREFIVDNLTGLGASSVPLATLFGIPMYAAVASVVPIVAPLPGLGVSLGTTVAFLMSVAALSLPEAMILKRVMSWKLISIFFGIVAVGIILIGYIIDLL